jgi:hypothetical protein
MRITMLVATALLLTGCTADKPMSTQEACAAAVGAMQADTPERRAFDEQTKLQYVGRGDKADLAEAKAEWNDAWRAEVRDAADRASDPGTKEAIAGFADSGDVAALSTVCFGAPAATPA